MKVSVNSDMAGVSSVCVCHSKLNNAPVGVQLCQEGYMCVFLSHCSVKSLTSEKIRRGFLCKLADSCNLRKIYLNLNIVLTYI